MVNKILATILVCALSLGTLMGCQSMGKVTGETAKEIEQGADEFEEGYKKGKGDY